MVAAVAGFATLGIIPVARTFAVFGLMGAHEQFRTAVAYGAGNVKPCYSHNGLAVAPTAQPPICWRTWRSCARSRTYSPALFDAAVLAPSGM